MFTETVSRLDMPQIRKTILHQMAEHYEVHLPDSLYLSHYALSEMFGFTPKEWSDFLKIKEINMLIESEIAQIAEIGARKALQRLQSGTAASADISAARELLANSRLLKQKTNQKQQFILTRVPPKEVTSDATD